MRKIDEDVTITIGRKHFIDGKLKNVWGKRLPIKIQKSATCSDILRFTKLWNQPKRPKTTQNDP